MHSRHTPFNNRQHAALCAYARSRVTPCLRDPAAWFGLSFALRQSAASGVFDVLKQAKPTRRTRRSASRPPSKPSAPDIETRLFALFAE